MRCYVLGCYQPGHVLTPVDEEIPTAEGSELVHVPDGGPLRLHRALAETANERNDCYELRDRLAHLCRRAMSELQEISAYGANLSVLIHELHAAVRDVDDGRGKG